MEEVKDLIEEFRQIYTTRISESEMKKSKKKEMNAFLENELDELFNKIEYNFNKKTNSEIIIKCKVKLENLEKILDDMF